MERWELICEVRSAADAEIRYIPSRLKNIVFSCTQTEENAISRKYCARVSNAGEAPFCGVIHIKAMVKAEQPKIFMPGYIYGRNTAEMNMENRKAFPRLMANSEDRCKSPFWMTRADRLAEPVSLVYDGGRILGISAVPYWIGSTAYKKPGKERGCTKLYQFGGFTCNICDGDAVSVGYTLGYENAPFLFVQTAKVLERAPITSENAFVLQAGEEVQFELTIFDYSADDARGINLAIEQVYRAFHEPPRSIAGMTERRAMEMLSAAVRDYAWLEDEKMYTGFVYDRPEGYAYNQIGSLSWTNGFAVAAPMLLAANKIQDDKARAQALAFFENVFANAANFGANLLYDAVTDGNWSVKGWWYSGMRAGGHSAYINGQAVYYILQAYLSEKTERGVVHDAWLPFVAPVIRQMNSQLDEDYEYPFSFSEEDGHGLEYDSMGGVWCLAATALYARIAGTNFYHDILRRSEQHYFEKYVKRMECYGGPLDTDKAVDDEGILAYIRAVRILHELTGDGMYLDHLHDALCYECSFKLGYNTPVQVRPLSEIHWSSCGGSITSTANPHIHPMSNTVISEMEYYVAHTGDRYIRDRLKDTIGWGLQTFNTYEKEYGYGRIGWMSERFCFCQGLLTEKYPNGETASTWFALMPWASASILEGLARERTTVRT